MKYCLLLLFLPFFVNAQTDTSIIYRDSYLVKGSNDSTIYAATKAFIGLQRNKFFYLSSYNKTKIPANIDSSNYGKFTINNEKITVNCMFIYAAKDIDVVYADVVFTAINNLATMQLQNVTYSHYEKEKGEWWETQRGLYKDLQLCKHCSVSGIKLAETVNKGFVRSWLAYKAYLKQAGK